MKIYSAEVKLTFRVAAKLPEELCDLPLSEVTEHYRTACLEGLMDFDEDEVVIQDPKMVFAHTSIRDDD